MWEFGTQYPLLGKGIQCPFSQRRKRSGSSPGTKRSPAARSRRGGRAHPPTPGRPAPRTSRTSSGSEGATRRGVPTRKTRPRGVVIVPADDPELPPSQNEQDNRHYAVAAKIPMLEPSDSSEAKEFTRLAYELSEKYDTPVFLRTTTRISHAKGVVRLDEPSGPAFAPGFTPDPSKWVMLPA